MKMIFILTLTVLSVNHASALPDVNSTQIEFNQSENIFTGGLLDQLMLSANIIPNEQELVRSVSGVLVMAAIVAIALETINISFLVRDLKRIGFVEAEVKNLFEGVDGEIQQFLLDRDLTKENIKNASGFQKMRLWFQQATDNLKLRNLLLNSTYWSKLEDGLSEESQKAIRSQVKAKFSKSGFTKEVMVALFSNQALTVNSFRLILAEKNLNLRCTEILSANINKIKTYIYK